MVFRRCESPVQETGNIAALYHCHKKILKHQTQELNFPGVCGTADSFLSPSVSFLSLFLQEMKLPSSAVDNVEILK